MIPFLDLKKQIEPLSKQINNKIQEITSSGQFILGKEVKDLENEISEYLGVNHSIGVASGSDALYLALKALNISAEDEVITTPFTFFATAGSIARIGAKPVFVDIKRDTFNINPDLIEEKITNKTKAIIVVHLFGQSAEMDHIMKIAKKHNLKVIEDACQAIGAEYKGQKLGSIGDIGCFSFFPTKNLGGFGDGGIITTNDQSIANYLKKARVHGSSKKYHHEFVGINSRLDNIQAAVLRIKLPYLDSWNEKRLEIAKKYNEALKDKFVTPKIPSDKKHIFHQYALLAKNSEDRDKIMQKLKENEISTGIYYPIPLHLQECFKYLGYKKGDLPISEEISERIFSIPIYPEVDYKEVIRGFD